jgi:hypothetical protein
MMKKVEFIVLFKGIDLKKRQTFLGVSLSS